MTRGQNMDFKITAPFEPDGDQPQAIEKLAEGIEKGLRTQVLLGATGTGKTYTIAQVINKVNKPTLVIAHNKTLAAQLASEFKAFFPENSVEYFVSYYDYYQPEAYIPQSDTYIEKDASINDEIDKLRHSATSALFERRDVIIVASVSCIYGLGAPQEYYDMVLSLRVGQKIDRQAILRKLVEIQYDRNDIAFQRGTFRVRGDVIEVIPAGYNEKAVRIEMFDDEVERILEVDVLTGEILAKRSHVAIFPASHYVTSRENLDRAMEDIKVELAERLEYLNSHNKLLEAQRLEQRTNYDLEMMNEASSAALLVLDLDDFKNVNDSGGHAIGDLALQKLSSSLKNVFRDSDLIGRLGGDEFIIIMDNVKKLDKMDKLRKFKKVIRNRSVDVAIGFEWVENASEFDFGMKSADKKMYRNKKKYYKTHKLTERGDERAAAR